MRTVIIFTTQWDLFLRPHCGSIWFQLKSVSDFASSSPYHGIPPKSKVFQSRGFPGPMHTFQFWSMMLVIEQRRKNLNCKWREERENILYIFMLSGSPQSVIEKQNHTFSVHFIHMMNGARLFAKGYIDGTQTKNSVHL